MKNLMKNLMIPLESSHSVASVDLSAFAMFNQHFKQTLVASDLALTDNTADDIIIVEDDYSNQTMEEANFILMST